MTTTPPPGSHTQDIANKHISTENMVADALEMRYGINMSFANVNNKLMDKRRKPGKTLHFLYGRVMTTARRADYSQMERAYKGRKSFFTALRSDTDLQRYFGRRDKGFRPDIELTLSLALQYEMNYGTKIGAESSSANARQVSTSHSATPIQPITVRLLSISCSSPVSRLRRIL